MWNFIIQAMELLKSSCSIQNKVLHVWLPSDTKFVGVEFHYGETYGAKRYPMANPHEYSTSVSREKKRKEEATSKLLGGLG